jgi:hypothetical protein
MPTDLTIWIRREDDVPDTDDIISVKRLPGSLFEVTYRDGDIGTRYVQKYNKLEIQAYFGTLLSALTLDRCPFKYIQIGMNGFPNTQYAIDELAVNNAVWQVIFASINWCLEGHWVSQSAASSQAAQSSQTTSAPPPSTSYGSRQYQYRSPSFASDW